MSVGVSVRHCTVGHLPVRVPVEHFGVRVWSRLLFALLVVGRCAVERTTVWVLILHLYY